MSEESFFNFGQASRPDIGLIADSFQNLSEIYQSDKRSALRNIQIRPEILDSLYGVSSELNDREDFRFCSGLDKLLLPSLHQLREVYQYVIPTKLYYDKEFYNPDFPLGGEGSPFIKYPNVTIFNGSIQCEGAQYVSNVIGNTIFSSPEQKQVFLSTSRASLFNSEGDPVNPGYYKNARYPGSIRVRRRSHVNRVFIPPASFIPKPSVIESPTHTINVSVDNNNSGTVTPVKLLATKNTPLKIFCKLGKGSVKFTFVDSEAPYYFGFQIQPLQTRPNTEKVDFLSVVSTPQPTGSTEFTVTVDITKTGYQNIYDLYLYLYVVPEKVKGIEFSGIDIKESPDKKDLGLIGFSNLEVFKVSGGSMTILPIWLKTLKTKLKTLDLASSSDLWRSGLMGWFDIRDSSRTPSITHPLYTVASYLTIPKKGTLINENGDGWSSTLFSKYILNQSRVVNTDYRQFTAMENLILGSRFSGYAPRFDDIFPNLRSLDWSNTDTSRTPSQYLFSALPKLNNNGGLIDYNIRRSGAVGNITDIGTSTDALNSGHVSKYKMRSFNASGSWDIYNGISGYINNPSDPDWSAWRDSTIDINISYTGISINLQSGQWNSLTWLDAGISGGVKFDSVSSPLQTPKLKYLSAYGPGTTGKMASLGGNSFTNTGNLETLNIGYCVSLSPITENGIDYLLPNNFAPVRPEGSEHKLINFYTHYLYSPFLLRKNDLINLHSLQVFYSYGSKLTGRFPVFPVKKAYETETKLNYIYIDYSNFYDLQALSISPSNYYFARDASVIHAPGMNAGQGGAILPDLEGVNGSSVRVININSSLTTKYRYDWANPALRDCCILSGQQFTTLSSLAISRYPQNDIYRLTGSSNFTQTVLVNDSIRASEFGVELARVLSVSNTSITISSDIPDPLPSTLYFTRNTVDISNWFKAGFSSLVWLGASNCRLSGSINIRSGFSAIRDSSGYPAINLSNNVISSYVYGSLTKVFSGDSRGITVDLSNNVLPASEIRKIIEEVSILDNAKKFSNCLIKLYGNNLTSDKKYSNYSQQQIFPTTLSPGKDVITSLFRNESFQVYKEQLVVNSQLQEVYSYTLTGTQTLQFSGAEVSGLLYKTKRDKVQNVNEDYLAVKYGKLTGIRVDLGFTYTPPNTSPVILSTTYENETSRVASITESGLTPLTTCPDGIGSGLCWRNSLNQILKLV